MGYPPGDESLFAMRDQVYETWLSARRPISIINGRPRRCASQEGNALYSTLALGISDQRADRLAENLVGWQWPDGGWNCDRRVEAANSSFHETLIPMRGLALHAKLTCNSASKKAAERAAEILLKSKLLLRQTDGEVIHPNFLRTHYPCYWHYDFLFGLKVMAEAGFINDPRCSAALDMLESKRLQDGGLPAEAKYYRVSDGPVSGASIVEWGPTSARKMNEFVTVDALAVLRSACRLDS